MSAATFALGEKLVAELKLVESTDTLARWMAHYVAELMLRADQAALPERDEARQSCARAIMDLWSQARAFPLRKTAFESVDRVIETINSLHPDSGTYYRNDLWRALDERAANGGTEVEKLLTTALGIDGAARNLIHHVLAHASHIAGRDSIEWLKLAQQLDDEDPLTELRIMIVTAGQNEAQLKNHRVEQLEKRIAQLEHFAVVAQVLRTSLDESLAAAKAANNKLDNGQVEPSA